MVAEKCASRLQKAERDEKIALGAKKWLRESVAKRISLQKLALKLGCTVAKVKKALENPSEKARVAADKVKVAVALSQRNVRKDSAARVHRELAITKISTRSVQRMRAPIREVLLEERVVLKRARMVSPMDHDRIGKMAMRQAEDALVFNSRQKQLSFNCSQQSLSQNTQKRHS